MGRGSACAVFCNGGGNFGFHSRLRKRERCEPLWAAQAGEQTPILGKSSEEFFQVLLLIHQKAYLSFKKWIFKKNFLEQNNFPHPPRDVHQSPGASYLWDLSWACNNNCWHCSVRTSRMNPSLLTSWPKHTCSGSWDGRILREPFDGIR